jgi:nicotinate-nucleotide--dimethylbenzimidazole phosphoribosyltransferase
MSTALASRLAAITPVDDRLAPTAQAHLDDLTKPRGSLGRLEELALRLYVIGRGAPPAVDPARIFTVAGDHGVVAEGVSIASSEVTRQMIANFLAGGAGINVLARRNGIELLVVDAGVAGGPFPEHRALIQAKIAPGTANIARGPAMSREDCVKALNLGFSLAERSAAEGIRCLGTGDMGIGNTTPSTALYCAFLGLDPVEITGPGAGLDAAGVARKAKVVARALAANQAAVASGDSLTILAALGGYEIATLAGLVLGAAARGLPVAVDGFISTAAALCALRLCPAAAGYVVYSHASAETGFARIAQAMGIQPLLPLGLRLGEGTGSALAIHLLRCAAAIFNEMATFSAAGVNKD